jgi:hypothetical protein
MVKKNNQDKIREQGANLNALRQVKTYGYRHNKRTMLNPNAMKPSGSMDHHSIIYSRKDIMTPVEWLAANDKNRLEPATRNMEGYAIYYIEKLKDLKVL